ncbi:MAG: nitrogen fixation protein NifH [Anaerolineae bacterium]|nr:nitrogen fixation protein NifH [Anaerolineae bacterium]
MPHIDAPPASLTWLLEPEPPGVRYLVLRDLLERPADDPELLEARRDAYERGPIAEILANMQTQGYWERPGNGYNPKYRSAVWSLILLAQLGASIDMDERIAAAIDYHLCHGLAAGGQFGSSGAPSSTVDCLQGNMCWALLALGAEPAWLALPFEWMARTVTGEGMAPRTEKQAQRRYYAGKCGALFQCGANNNLACAWGAAKVMLAFSRLPVDYHTPLIQNAIRQGIDFLFSVDPATAAYPSGWTDKPSGNWWKFGFPVFYITDILQIVEALAALGCGADPRLANALELVRTKQDAQGRWSLEVSYAGKTWGEYGEKKQPNKWVTQRALRTLKLAGSA